MSLELWQLGIIIGLMAAITAVVIRQAMIWSKPPSKPSPSASDIVEDRVEEMFNEKFREELRERGRAYFEKIISENAMFLQQDLRLTTSQLNDFMKQEITKTLKEEFGRYEQSITDAKKLAVESIEKTQDAIEEQRKVLSQQLTNDINLEKASRIRRFETNMSEIISHYLVEAIGDQIDLSDQQEYILGQLTANKAAMLDDIKRGT